ncbi:hypothetical protein FB446DRAFT_830935, partial [Lentinula raphanica]
RRFFQTFLENSSVLFTKVLQYQLAAAYVVYTENLLPAARNGYQIPAEMCCRRRMDVSHLRPFGAFGWGAIVDGPPGKLDIRGYEGRMIGYGKAGEYLLFLKNGRVGRSCDVSFEERHIPPLLVAGEDESRTIEEVEGPTNTNSDSDDIDLDPKEQRIDDPNNAEDVNTPNLKSNSDPSAEPQTLRRSARIPKPPPSLIASREYETRHRSSRGPVRQPQANFTVLAKTVAFIEVDHEFNAALTAVGLPPVPRSYGKAMEDPDCWNRVIEKEKEKMVKY